MPDQDHARFVREHREPADTSGEVVTTDGTVVGRHEGVEQFTIGQRKGLGIALGEPRYVVRIDPQTRQVVLGTREELARRELTAAGSNWLVDRRRATSFCQVKIRYRSPAVEGRLELLSGERFRVEFTRPCHGVAPGQAAVCYQGDRRVGRRVDRVERPPTAPW